MMRRQDAIKQNKKTIAEYCYINDKLLGGMDCKISFDTGASKTFMSKTFHINCPSLHSLPVFVSKTKNI